MRNIEAGVKARSKRDNTTNSSLAGINLLAKKGPRHQTKRA